MADCMNLEKCPFFNDKMVNLPATAEIYNKKFCRGDFENCARLMVSRKLGKEKVPVDYFQTRQTGRRQ